MKLIFRKKTQAAAKKTDRGDVTAPTAQPPKGTTGNSAGRALPLLLPHFAILNGVTLQIRVSQAVRGDNTNL